jgi:hypothetical protein
MQAKLEERVSKLEKSGIPGLRDFFATSALETAYVMRKEVGSTPKSVAKGAYELAEAMIEERKKYNAPTE